MHLNHHNHKTRIATILAFLVFIFIKTSCAGNAHNYNNINQDKTIVLYIVANNNLISQAELFLADINDYVKTNPELSEIAHLVVFYNSPDGSILLTNNNTHLVKIKEYGNINSLSQENMSMVLDDIRRMFPAKESGIVFWSHGTGWLTSSNTRSFGDDGGESIEINEIAESLKYKYDYIIFDACYMSCIEVATALKDKCLYFLASPESVPIDGIINTTTISILAQERPLQYRLISICNLYSEANNGKHIAIIDERRMDVFINFVKDLIIDPSNFTLEKTKSYDFRGYGIFFDIKTLFVQLCDKARESIDSVIVYPINRQQESCGVSVFIPTQENINYQHSYSFIEWNRQTNWVQKWKQCNE